MRPHLHGQRPPAHPTPAGGQICVSAAVAVDHGICVTVADTGIGMTAAQVQIALTKFGQVDGGLDRKKEGTGLGLPLVKAQTELHGGDLSVVSQPGGGTSVTVQFPPSRTVPLPDALGPGSASFA